MLVHEEHTLLNKMVKGCFSAALYLFDYGQLLRM